MLIALVQPPSPRLAECELTYRKRETIDFNRALEQHNCYSQALESCGAQVRSLPVNTAHPDGAFVEDVAVVLDEIAVMCSMGVASRKGEVEAVASELARYRVLQRIAPPATLEGGDVVRMGRTLFVGLSPRTNAEGFDALRRFAEPHGYRVIALEVWGCLHLKSACTAINETSVLANPSWLAVGASERLRAERIEIVPVPLEEPEAANVVALAGGLILAASHPRTAELLARRGESVQPVDLSEFAKAEACATCLSLVFENRGGG